MKIKIKFVNVEFLMLIELMLSMLLNETKFLNSILNVDINDVRNTKKFKIENVDEINLFINVFNIEIIKKNWNVKN